MIIPMLVCRNAAAEINFCKCSFDAVELSCYKAADGSVLHATLQIGGALLMVHGETKQLESHAPQTDGSSPVVIYLYQEETDPVIEKAVNNGARVLIPATDHFWGDRVGRIIDPEGHVWNIASHINKE